MTLNQDGKCANTEIMGFTVHDLPPDQLVAPLSGTTTAQCPTSYANFSAAYPSLNIPSIITLAKESIMYDFTEGSFKNHLTDLVYPCIRNEKVWADGETLFWDCWTSAAASFGPVVLVIRSILREIEKRWQKRYKKVRGGEEDDSEDDEEEMLAAGSKRKKLRKSDMAKGRVNHLQATQLSPYNGSVSTNRCTILNLLGH